VVGNFDVVVLTELHRRVDLEGGGELQWRQSVEMDVGDIGGADDAEVLQVELLLQVDGDQILQHFLPDIAGKLLADQVGGRLTGPEAL